MLNANRNHLKQISNEIHGIMKIEASRDRFPTDDQLRHEVAVLVAVKRQLDKVTRKEE